MKRRVYLTYFRKGEDRLAGEISLPDMDLQVLRVLFDASDEDQMYGEIPLLERNAKKLIRLVAVDLDFSQFDYFLECDTPADV